MHCLLVKNEGYLAVGENGRSNETWQGVVRFVMPMEARIDRGRVQCEAL